MASEFFCILCSLFCLTLCARILGFTEIRNKQKERAQISPVLPMKLGMNLPKNSEATSKIKLVLFAFANFNVRQIISVSFSLL